MTSILSQQKLGSLLEPSAFREAGRTTTCVQRKRSTDGGPDDDVQPGSCGRVESLCGRENREYVYDGSSVVGKYVS